jgi:diguanylate cyclase
MKNFEQNLLNNLEEDKEDDIEKVNYKFYPERRRVDKLRDADNKYEDSIMKLAEWENKKRDLLLKKGISKEDLNDVIKDFSEVKLESMEHEQEKFLDPLTQIGNRRFMENEIPKILSLQKREKQESSVIMLDIDHFKNINDQFGHDMGDKVLKNIVRIIKDNLRDSDFVFRYGGEEFTVYLPDTDTKEAQKVAENIRQKVQDAQILERTISLGCISTSDLEEWQKDQKDINMKEIMNILIKKADQALYYSKEHGRNQVAPYSQELEEKE